MVKKGRDQQDAQGLLFCSFCGKNQNEVKKLVAGTHGVRELFRPAAGGGIRIVEAGPRSLVHGRESRREIQSEELHRYGGLARRRRLHRMARVVHQGPGCDDHTDRLGPPSLDGPMGLVEPMARRSPWSARSLALILPDGRFFTRRKIAWYSPTQIGRASCRER